MGVGYRSENTHARHGCSMLEPARVYPNEGTESMSDVNIWYSWVLLGYVLDLQLYKHWQHCIRDLRGCRNLVGYIGNAESSVLL